DDARGFGKTASLHYLARRVNRDLGYEVLSTHEFDKQEAAATPILAAMGTFNTNDVTTLSAVSREQVVYLAQPDADTGRSCLDLVRDRILQSLEADGQIAPGTAAQPGPAERQELEKRVIETDLKIGGKTLGLADRMLIGLFASGNSSAVLEYLK